MLSALPILTALNLYDNSEKLLPQQRCLTGQGDMGGAKIPNRVTEL